MRCAFHAKRNIELCLQDIKGYCCDNNTSIQSLVDIFKKSLIKKIVVYENTHSTGKFLLFGIL